MDEERLGQELQDYFKAEVKKVEPSPEWWNRAISRLSEHKENSRSGKTAFWKLRPSLITVPLSIFLLVILVGGLLSSMGGMAPPPPPAPTMVSDGSGGAFLIWVDEPYQQYEAVVLTQHVDAQGNLIWGKDGRQLAAGYAGQPYAIGDDNGGIMVAWKDDSGSHLSRLDPDGDTIWVMERFSSRSVMGMVKDGFGGAILLIYDPNDGIFTQRVSSEGSILWGENGTFLGYTQEVHQGESLVSDGLGGAVIIWQEQGKNYYTEIRAQRLSPEGLLLWGDDGIIVASMKQGQSNNRDIIVDSRGNTFIAWDTESAMSGAPDTDVYVQKLDGDGNKQWGEEGIQVCQDQAIESYSPANMQSQPQIATDGTGGVVVTWQDRRRILNSEIFAQRISPIGEMLWSGNGVWLWDIPADYPRTAGVLDSSINGDGTGGAIIVWTGYGDPVGNKNSMVYAQRLSPEGQRLWESEEVYHDPSFQSQGYSSVISDGQGGVIIGSRVGESSSVSKTDSVYVQRISSDGKHVWGEGGLGIQMTRSALTVQFIAGGAILAAILVLFGVFRRNRIAGTFTAILPVLLGIAGLLSVFLVIGPFGYTYGWAYIPDTALNKLAAFMVPFAGLAIVVVGISKKTATKWVMIPVLVFCVLVAVIAGLVLAF